MCRCSLYVGVSINGAACPHFWWFLCCLSFSVWNISVKKLKNKGMYNKDLNSMVVNCSTNIYIFMLWGNKNNTKLLYWVIANVDVALPSLAALFNVYLCSLILRVVLHSEPAPSAMSALHHFGAEMLRLSRGLEASAATKPQYRGYTNWHIFVRFKISNRCGNQRIGIYISNYWIGFSIFQFALKLCIAFYVLNVPVWTYYTRHCFLFVLFRSPFNIA